MRSPFRGGSLRVSVQFSQCILYYYTMQYIRKERKKRTPYLPRDTRTDPKLMSELWAACLRPGCQPISRVSRSVPLFFTPLSPHLFFTHSITLLAKVVFVGAVVYISICIYTYIYIFSHCHFHFNSFHLFMQYFMCSFIFCSFSLSFVLLICCRSVPTFRSVVNFVYIHTYICTYKQLYICIWYSCHKPHSS